MRGTITISDQQIGRNSREEFIQSIAEGHALDVTAQRLGISVVTARTWAYRLAHLVIDLRGTQGQRPRGVCKDPMPIGITLVYSADTIEASPGQHITFTAWVMNDTDEPLSGVYLIVRSFTNEGMENLRYATEPPASQRRLHHLPPGGSASWTFTYVVTERDLSHGGELISAMGVQAITPATTLWDEDDAIVFFKPAPVSSASKKHAP
jgi:hypothetical protein